jgi:hypothetical protein
MPHAGICTVSARQDEDERCVQCADVQVCVGAGLCIFCCRTAAISAPFTPLLTFRFQPLPTVAFHAIDVDITFHCVTSQFSAFGRLSIARRSLALLAGLGVSRQYRWPQISTFTDLTIARRFCSVGSHMQPSMAFSRRRWQSHGVGKATPSHPTPLPKCSSPEHTKNRQNKTKDLFQCFSGVFQAFRRRSAGLFV